MKIRSVNELSDFLDTEMSWRKRELITIRFMILDCKGDRQRILLRSGFCLLYAHWEGFIKNSATYYLHLLAYKGLRYDELNEGLVALCLRRHMESTDKSTKIRSHLKITTFFLSQSSEKAKIPLDGIETHDNLKEEYFTDILNVLCLDRTKYESKFPLLDARLLKSRNEIAHGEENNPDFIDYDSVYEAIKYMIETFRNDLLNSAQSQSYKR